MAILKEGCVIAKKKKYYIRPDGLHETIRIINGRRIAFRGHTDAEVERKMLEFKGEIERGPLFKDVIEDWDKIHTPTIAYTTRRGYESSIKRAIKYHGDDYIKQISAAEIKDVLNELNRLKCSQKTIRTQLLIYSLVFAYAAENGIVTINVCKNVVMPKYITPSKKRDSASEEDEKKIIDHAKDWLFPLFVLYTGLRKGEALAIQFKDIDRKKNSSASRNQFTSK